MSLDVAALDAVVERILGLARIPGAAIAVVADGQAVFAKGYGYRDLQAQLPMTAKTVYPIGSTTKAINAALLGMLVDDGELAWDAPVQQYLPRFRLHDAVVSAQVTLRDLVTMRTGLPRHDWSRIEIAMSRAELVERLRYLQPSAGFRERFQYNNLTVTTAGHVAELVTGRSWEDLVQARILEPLAMHRTGFTAPTAGEVSLSYHEDRSRSLILTQRRVSEVVAPSGSTIHSTVEDMTSWLQFNLSGGKVADRQLIKPGTLAEIQAPQVVAGAEPSAPTPKAAYAMGWFVDTYNGCARLSHGGYVHDVHSEVMLFPTQGIGIVSFINFGPPMLARLINQWVFDLFMGNTPVETAEEKLARYEKGVENTKQRNASVPRVANTVPSHSLIDYAGIYAHPGYGNVEIQLEGRELVLRRNRIVLPLEHWHYDAWIVKENEMFHIHVPHALDPTSRLLFETNADGQICAVLIHLEPAVAPIRFTKARD